MFELIEHDRLSWSLLLLDAVTDFLHHPAQGTHDLSLLRFFGGYANMVLQVIVPD